MTEVQIASMVFVCVFGSALCGLFLRDFLPEDHFSQDSKDVVKLGTGLIATLSALVLSLLISSAQHKFDAMDTELVQNAARVVALDRILADYGPETDGVREDLKRMYAARIELLFPSDEAHAGTLDSADSVIGSESLRTKLLKISPRSDAQRWLHSQALRLATEISSTRWLLLMQRDVSMPTTLLVVLVLWLVLIFSTFGLLAPRNMTVVVALFVCALSTSGAILLILEMNGPFVGLIKLSSAPMRDALADLGH